jgi:hypothetical protein
MEGLNLLLKTSIGEGNLLGIEVSRLIKILHLVFVEDVLIMTRASLHEWKEIDRIIKLFYEASRLWVNQTKTIVHFEGLTEVESAPFKTVLPYTFSDRFQIPRLLSKDRGA